MKINWLRDILAEGIFRTGSALIRAARQIERLPVIAQRATGLLALATMVIISSGNALLMMIAAEESRPPSYRTGVVASVGLAFALRLLLVGLYGDPGGLRPWVHFVSWAVCLGVLNRYVYLTGIYVWLISTLTLGWLLTCRVHISELVRFAALWSFLGSLALWVANAALLWLFLVAGLRMGQLVPALNIMLGWCWVIMLMVGVALPMADRHEPGRLALTDGDDGDSSVEA